MVEVISLSDDNRVKELFSKQKIEYIPGKSNAMAAIEKENEIGICLFNTKVNKSITIKYIFPENDYSLADGMLRSALFFAANHGIMEAYWENPVTFELINKLGFVQNQEKCSIDITKLFSSCENCKNY